MARKRIFYLAVVLAALLLLLYTDSFLSAFFLAVVVFLPVVSLLVSLPAMTGCHVRIEADTAAVERGGAAHWRVAVENRRRLPLSRIQLRIRLRNEMTGETSLRKIRLSGASSACSFLLDADTAHCGMLSCRLLRCRVLDGMGLFGLSRRGDASALLPVMPSAEESEDLPDLPDQMQEQPTLRARRGGGSGEDYDLRPYRPGDPVRLIHWKLSSKRDELIFREILESETAVPLLTFDHVGTPEEMDRILDRLWAVSRRLLEQQRDHVISWLHPETGALREFAVSGERELQRCFQAILSDPAPAAGRRLSEEPSLPANGGRVRLHLGLKQEEAV